MFYSVEFFLTERIYKEYNILNIKLIAILKLEMSHYTPGTRMGREEV
jgi:hypothetical protein